MFSLQTYNSSQTRGRMIKGNFYNTNMHDVNYFRPSISHPHVRLVGDESQRLQKMKNLLFYYLLELHLKPKTFIKIKA